MANSLSSAVELVREVKKVSKSLDANALKASERQSILFHSRIPCDKENPIVSLNASSFTEDHEVKVKATVDGTNVVYSVADTTFTVPISVVQKLSIIAKSRNADITDKQIDKKIALMYLKYMAMGSTNRQTCCSLKLSTALYESGYRCEGFASPFACGLMEVAQDPTDISYCSLFPEIESEFGSRGSFFTASFKNEKVFVHPPRIEEFLVPVVEHLRKSLESGNGVEFAVIVYDDKDYEYLYEQLSDYVSEGINFPAESRNPFTGEPVGSKNGFVSRMVVLKDCPKKDVRVKRESSSEKSDNGAEEQ